MAAPHVAGIAALVWSVNPSLSRDQVADILKSTAIDLGPPGKDNEFGYGRVDAAAAVRMAIPAFTITADMPQPPSLLRAPAVIRGWAIDRRSGAGSGINGVHVYLDGPAGTGRFVGEASYGFARADVGAVYGARFTNSGYSLAWGNPVEGDHNLYIYAHSTSGRHTLHVFAKRACDEAWVEKVVAVTLPTTIITVDSPKRDQQIGGAVEVKGWAIDPSCGIGTGVSAVHIYRDVSGGSGVPLAIPASYGSSRPDVGGAFGNSRFINSGFSFGWSTGGLSGSHTVHILVQRACDGSWTETTVPVTVLNTKLQIDAPAGGSGWYSTSTIVVRGWAIDPSCGTGTGVSTVHVYRDVSGGAGVPLAVPAATTSRADVGAAYGSSRFNNSGFSASFKISGSPGWHTIHALAQNACDGGWTEKTVSIYISTPSVARNFGYGMAVTSVRDSPFLATSTSLRKVKDAGFDLVLAYVNWGKVEPVKWQYDWSFVEDTVKQARAYGLQVVLRIDRPPPWANGGTNPKAAPSRPEDLADFVNALGGHLGGDIYGLVILNEPNLASEWGGPPDPAAYMRLLKTVYSRAKQSWPASHMKIISAPLAATNDLGPNALDDRTYMRRLYEGGLKDYSDLVGVNAFGLASSPDSTTDASSFNFSRVQQIRDVMVANGDVNKQVWALEVGWLLSTAQNLGSYNWMKVSEAQQAEYLKRAYQKAYDEWSWMEAMFVWNLDFSMYALTSSDSPEMPWFSALNSDGSERQAYRALKEMWKAPTLSGTSLPVVGREERPVTLVK